MPNKDSVGIRSIKFWLNNSAHCSWRIRKVEACAQLNSLNHSGPRSTGGPKPLPPPRTRTLEQLTAAARGGTPQQLTAGTPPVNRPRLPPPPSPGWSGAPPTQPRLPPPSRGQWTRPPGVKPPSALHSVRIRLNFSFTFKISKNIYFYSHNE